jgi:outer membrane receptor protein involved in Fe transport
LKKFLVSKIFGNEDHNLSACTPKSKIVKLLGLILLFNFQILSQEDELKTLGEKNKNIQKQIYQLEEEQKKINEKIEKLENKNEKILKPSSSEQEKSNEESFFKLEEEIVFIAAKKKQRIKEAPSVVSIISDKQIKDFGRTSLNDILYQLPGFSPSRVNERKTVSSRGLFEGWNNNHLLMLVDGVQHNELFYGSALTWELTPLNMVKSIEVIRGPGSALYGSNATNGVVSLNTYSGSDLKGSLNMRTRVGDYGTRIYDFMTGNSGKMFSYILSYNSYQTNGNEFSNYDGSGKKDAFGFLQKFPIKDSHKSYYLFSKIEGEGNLKGFSFQYHRQNWTYENFNGWLQSVPDMYAPNREGRDIFILKYAKNISDKLSHEYVIRHTTNFWDYNARLYPSGNKSFPNGLTEQVHTNLQNNFGRAQITYLFGNGGSFISGLEANELSYKGDKSHTSNADLNLYGSGRTNPSNMNLPLNPIMDWITNKPIYKIAPFLQITTGKLFNKNVEFTFGVRYDESQYHFRGIDYPYKEIFGSPTAEIYDPITSTSIVSSIPIKNIGPPFITNEKKIYRKTSPRFGIVYFLSNKLTLKFLAGRAFREPSVGELFGVNTYIAGSNNPRKISPEVIKTMEVAIDWVLNTNYNFRLNIFQTRFENVIDYSGTTNLLQNVYTMGNRGVEAEILVNFKYVNGFVNYSRFQRYLEHNLDAKISKTPNEVTISPASTANFGLSTNWKDWQASISVQRQGEVIRRKSDIGKIDPLTGMLQSNEFSNPYSYPTYRPKDVPAWTNINLRISYKILENMSLAINVYNALNEYQTTVQRLAYPNDYIREGRRFLLDFQASF